MSAAEAEYVTSSASCAQVLWMRTQLKDYGFDYNIIPLYYDSQSAIAISCNPVQHSRAKHINVGYHFIKEQVERSIVELYFFITAYQLADIFTKPLSQDSLELYAAIFLNLLSESAIYLNLLLCLLHAVVCLICSRSSSYMLVCANNDIHVLDNYPLFDDLLDDKSHVAPYVLNGVGFEKGYYSADGIYPQWATFVKSFTVANDAKHAYIKKRQESARKNVERAFGVLQERWGIIQQPTRQYHVNNIRRIMYSCIIMHNVILEDQKMTVFDWN
uniref:Protein ALP1-like n=1 Tax=Tanacetum cinerariifolium TaxID=118510 RepID=A0A6L2P4H6_TANCI|nr:protein ALP1-like [Tanacetum cinerariifolium]GEU92807.1 protein ALP1-like [Tanacetum cinerariifolium]